MPKRYYPLVTGETYHVFNRGIAHTPIFTDIREYKRAIATIKFYQIDSQPIKLSRYLVMSSELRTIFYKVRLRSADKLVDIIGFCLMPNHFHFLLKQLKDKGISTFMRILQNSYTRYFNTKNKRDGPILKGQFKAVRIERDEQLLHVSRYIHLNPYTSFITRSVEDLLKYPWSSLPEYVNYIKKERLCNRNLVLSLFKSAREYKKFVLNHADYQRNLKSIKHLTLE
ncbi:hypothetical protein A2714_00295 [Candidatus Woesebacteria bacterium RIFCSPHIGHO2_01_FULL_38_9]|uniref:Transposase IS200-like domain-containing protein n=2 Tax=Candidatus Woeseibacteriota TaxID=1752722 RepID=A0A1F7Y2J9_9BACT|nr:MAG: hypothetical protein A2714_00295 [Candidatus Woesebacteria bacterium RIFCSPHIGHO2_01_FULL_38_9]OGM58236.1 MAG: hypothetical protein A3A75_04320 [Candidatus Woesebacteria bacterium RIFCSPLOWO2_01_FULL_39_10]